VKISPFYYCLHLLRIAKNYAAQLRDFADYQLKETNVPCFSLLISFEPLLYHPKTNVRQTFNNLL